MATITITVKAKEWARYYAQDDDGSWWQFSHEPEQGEGYWIVSTGRSSYVTQGSKPADWTQQLF
jgi:hypothetical protein